jgi:hypothetical protein
LKSKYIINYNKHKMKNWKTTVAGIAVAILGVAVSMGYITTEVAGAITTIAVSLGLLVSKDAGVTGTEK